MAIAIRPDDVMARIRKAEAALYELQRERKPRTLRLRDAVDVRLVPATTGQVPTYDRADGLWKPSTPVVLTPAATVVSETAFGQAAAVGGDLSYARQGHTHGTPADPVPGHVAAGDPHTQYVTSVTANAPLTSTAGRTPAISATTGQTAGTLAAGNDDRFPTAGQKAALPGTAGVPSGTNLYVTGDDPRNTNARTPTAHATTHAPGGTDAIATGTPGTLGFGGAPAEGNATTIARSNHAHGMPADPVPAHEAAADPHVGYQKESERAVAGGYAPLAAVTALVPTAHLGAGTALATNFLRGDGTWATQTETVGGVANRGGTPGLQAGLGALRPAAGAAAGDEYYGTNTGTKERWSGVVWEVVFSRDPAVGVAGLRTLGTGSLQATAGDDARLSNARTPLAHAASHVTGGADAIAIAVATASSPGNVAAIGAAAAFSNANHVHGRESYGSVAGTVAQGNDPRFTDSRSPLAHAASHSPGGTDAITGQVRNFQNAPAWSTGTRPVSGLALGHMHHNPGPAEGDYWDGTAWSLAYGPSLTTPIDIDPGTPGNQGDIRRYAYANHRHGTHLYGSAITSSGPGAAGTNGVSNTYARGDHAHGRESYGVTAGTVMQGNEPTVPRKAENATITGLWTFGALTSFTGGARFGPATGSRIEMTAAGKQSFHTPTGAGFSVEAYNATPGGIGAGITIIEEATGRTVAAGCTGSAFWDIGPNLRQTAGVGGASGKNLRMGVAGTGAEADPHQVIFKYAGGGSTGSITTLEDNLVTPKLRQVTFNSGTGSTDTAASFIIESGTRPRFILDADFTQFSGRYINGNDIFSSFTNNAVFGNGAFTNRGLLGGYINMFYDSTNQIGHIATVRENVGWNKLKLWASYFEFCINGFGTPVAYITAAGAFVNSSQSKVVSVTTSHNSGNGYTEGFEVRSSAVNTRAGVCFHAEGFTGSMIVAQSSLPADDLAAYSFDRARWANFRAILTNQSSARYKKDIVEVAAATMLDAVDSLPKVVRFRMKNSEPEFVRKTMPLASEFSLAEVASEHVGFLAEDVAAIMPSAVSYDGEGRPDGIRVGGMFALAIGAAKELHARHKTLRAAHEILKAETGSLKAEMAALRSEVAIIRRPV